MEATEILATLAEHYAVLTGQHFIYTSGTPNNHGPAYIDMRRVGHLTRLLKPLGHGLGDQLASYGPDLVIGPETLGRTLATHVGAHLGIDAIWCDIVETDGAKVGQFNPKLNFGRLIKGKRVIIVDDLLTTGGSIQLVANLIKDHGGEVVAAGAVVRRTPDVDAEKCGVPILIVMAEVDGFVVLSFAECVESGPCSRQEPIIRRPGHGWKWEESHPDYAGGYVDSPS